MKRTALILILFGCLAGLSFGESKHNIGLGVILGEPTGVSFKLWSSQKVGFDAGAAWSFSGGEYFQIHGDMLFHNFELFKVETGRMSLYYGVGARIKFGEDAEGGNETTFSARIPVGLTYEFEKTPIELFLEFVPMLDLIPRTEFRLAGGIGARYYF